MKLRQTLTALACIALALPACKDDIKPDAARESASAKPKDEPAKKDGPKEASASSSASAAPSGPSNPAPTDASGIPASATGVLADGVADGILKSGALPIVKLVAPGEEPRAALSYELTEDKKQTTGMRMNLDMTMQAGETAVPPTKLPQIGMNVELAAGKKEAGGDIQVTGTVTKVAITANDPSEDAMTKALSPVMNGMKGMTIKYFVSSKGRARDVQVTMPPGADANATQVLEQMKQSFDSMVAPLPDEPVGVGASWVVISRLKTGADILQFTTYTLKSRKGAKVELDTAVKQLAASAALSGAGGGAGHVTKFLSSGTGSSSLDLTSLAPDKGTATVTGSMGLEAGAMGSMAVETKVKIDFSGPLP